MTDSQHPTHLTALRQALKEGEESGKSDYTLTGLIEELDSENPL
jgi:antitoxin ParD1/3/4